jgi:hypothetical protein
MYCIKHEVLLKFKIIYLFYISILGGQNRSVWQWAFSTSLTTDSNISAKETILVGRPISARALTVRADIFHSVFQLLQEDVTLIT